MRTSPPRLSYEQVIRTFRRRSFGVLASADDTGRPHAVGVVYGVSDDGRDIYVMTRRHLKKARDIAGNPAVSMTVPISRRWLWFVPPPCIQFDGVAEVLDGDDVRGRDTFARFRMGRRVLSMYRDLERRGDRRACFLRITPRGTISTYMLGHSLWETARRMEVGAEVVSVPPEP